MGDLERLRSRLERLAERGDERGADAVLAGARERGEGGDVAHRRRRAPLAASAAVLVLLALLVAVLATGDDAPSRVATGPNRPGEPAIVPVPPIGEVRAEWLPDGTPVFVANDDEDGVVVVSARDGHLPGGASRHLLWWCESARQFEGPWSGGKYGLLGRKVDGPAPHGLVRYETEAVAGDPDSVRVLHPLAPPGLELRGEPRQGSSCLGRLDETSTSDAVGPVVRHRYPRPGEPVLTVTEARQAADGVVQVDGVWTVHDGTPGLCGRLADGRCEDATSVADGEAIPDPYMSTYTGLLLVRVDAGSLSEVVTLDGTWSQPAVGPG